MGILYQMGQFTGATTGTLQGMDYTPDFMELTLAVGFLTQSVNALTIALDNSMLGVTASTVPGTMANSARESKLLLKAIANLDNDGSSKNAQGLAALGTIAKQLAGLSSTIASGVATNQIIAADQIKKNAFDKEATQAALKRNNLPEVTVTPTNMLDSIRSAIVDAGNVSAQATAVGFVTNTANTAIGAASSYVIDLLPSFGDITNQFKSFTLGKQADPEGTTIRAAADVLINSTTA